MAGCQWVGPEQDPARAPLVFCGCKTLWPGRSYCEEHVWRVYQKGSAQGMSRKNKAIEKELAAIRDLENRTEEEMGELKIG